MAPPMLHLSAPRRPTAHPKTSALSSGASTGLQPADIEHKYPSLTDLTGDPGCADWASIEMNEAELRRFRSLDLTNTYVKACVTAAVVQHALERNTLLEDFGSGGSMWTLASVTASLLAHAKRRANDGTERCSSELRKSLTSLDTCLRAAEESAVVRAYTVKQLNNKVKSFEELRKYIARQRGKKYYPWRFADDFKIHSSCRSATSEVARRITEIYTDCIWKGEALTARELWFPQ